MGLILSCHLNGLSVHICIWIKIPGHLFYTYLCWKVVWRPDHFNQFLRNLVTLTLYACPRSGLSTPYPRHLSYLIQFFFSKNPPSFSHVNVYVIKPMKQLIRQHHMDHKLRNVLALAVPPLWTSKYVEDCCSRFQTAALKAVPLCLLLQRNANLHVDDF